MSSHAITCRCRLFLLKPQTKSQRIRKTMNTKMGYRFFPPRGKRYVPIPCIGLNISVCQILFSYLLLRSALHQFHTCWWPHRCNYLLGIIYCFQFLLCSSALQSSVPMLCRWVGLQWLNIELGNLALLSPQHLK